MTKFIAAVPRYAKAVAGGVVSAGAALNAAMADGHVTGLEWIGIPIAFLIGAGVVAAVPNKTGA